MGRVGVVGVIVVNCFKVQITMQKMYSGRIVYMQLNQNNLCAHADG